MPTPWAQGVAVQFRARQGKKPKFSTLGFASPDVQIVDFNKQLEVESDRCDRVVTFGNEGDKVLMLATMLETLSTPRAGLRPSEVSKGLKVDTGQFPPVSLFQFPVEGLLRHSDFSSVALGRLGMALLPS